MTSRARRRCSVPVGVLAAVAASCIVVGIFVEPHGAPAVSASASPIAATPGAHRGPAQTMAGSELPALDVAISRASDLGPVPARMHIDVDLALRGRDPAALQAVLDAGVVVGTARWASTYGPDPEAVSRLRAVLSAAGLSSGWQPGQALLRVGGPARALERFLGVSLHRYLLDGRLRFWAPTTTVRVPAALGPEVTAVTGTDDYPDEQMAYTPGPNGVSPAEMTGFYDLQPLRQAGLDGSGVTVMFPEWDVPSASVLAAYAQRFGLPPFDVTVEQPLGPVQRNIAAESEAALDLEVVHGLAPGAREIAYEVPTPAQLPDVVETMITGNPGAILSSSIDSLSCEHSAGIADYAKAMAAVFAQAASSGTTVLWASGDRGAFACLPDGNPKTEGDVSVSADADNPDVTAVGGTSAFLAANGAYYDEGAWGEPLEQWGSGGGISSIYPEPSYQQPAVSLGGRGVPDVACDADPDTSGWDVFLPPDPSQGQSGIQEAPVGGTSAAAPCWASILALVDEDLGHLHLPAVGFANPALYLFARYPAGMPATPFHEITEGSNLHYLAGAGWNPATGLGSPDAAHLADDFEWYDRMGRPAPTQ